MKAIVSDIHGNLEALRAVLEDIHSRGITEIVCLGDIVGYGPNPRECMELLKNADTLILGNHEEAVLLGDASMFNVRARRAVNWTRSQLIGDGAPSPEAAEEAKALLETFLKDTNIEGMRYVHGSPRDPTREYITPRDGANRKKMRELMEYVETFCFIGHSHVPGVFTTEGFTSPAEMHGVYMFEDEKAIINVGSVGQPRDGDPRACYCIFNVDTLTYVRVEYDVQTVATRIRAVPALDDALAERLLVGK
jgi:predicted phosphodiesterase